MAVCGDYAIGGCVLELHLLWHMIFFFFYSLLIQKRQVEKQHLQVTSNINTLCPIAVLTQIYPHLYDRSRRDFEDSEKAFNSRKKLQRSRHVSLAIHYINLHPASRSAGVLECSKIVYLCSALSNFFLPTNEERKRTSFELYRVTMGRYALVMIYMLYFKSSDIIRHL